MIVISGRGALDGKDDRSWWAEVCLKFLTVEANWQESLLLGTFLPDPETSLRYAACTAKVASIIKTYNAGRADGYAESAWHRPTKTNNLTTGAWVLPGRKG